jgi:hypothetical protein
MPRLIGTMARTAVIAGTATATRNAVDRRQASKNVAAEQQAYAQQAPPPPVQMAPAAAPPESMDDKLAQLERLGQLKAQGILSEEEFTQQKAAILG